MDDDDASPHTPPSGRDNIAPSPTLSSPTAVSSSSASTCAPDLADGTPLASAHAIVHLIQCPRCSQPLQAPLRLPCGNALCRSCLPPIRDRPGISYPAIEERKRGFTCYWEYETGCDGEHCLGDCGSDVLLTKLVDVFERVLGGPLPADTDTDTDTCRLSGDGYKVMWDSGVGGQLREKTVTGLSGGRGLLEGMYDLVRRGQFDYDASGVEYECFGDIDRGEESLQRLKEAVRGELDCQVCYSLMVDPLTTPCGHTFCRSCVAMVRSNSDLCPVCRRKVNMASSLESEPLNQRIAALLEILFPDQLAERRAALALEAADTDGETKLPLFVSSLSLPNMPTFLHVFEPRYRLMMRRVMLSPSRKFGMVMLNRARRVQPELGRSHFMQYGTALVVDRYELLPDGRSLVIATGVSRFRVTRSTVVDGYHVGDIQRVEDVSITEEERQEAVETSSAVAPPSAEDTSTEKPLESMSTQQLFQLALDFVRKQRGKAAPWLHPRVLLAYGDVPSDPDRFPWWFASVLPVWEEEKYALLPTTSVRERQKITAKWVRKLESREWAPRSRPSLTPLLWLAVPLVIFCFLPMILSPLVSVKSLPSVSVLTSFTPFPLSVSISFGSANSGTSDGREARAQDRKSETYLSQTVVLGVFLAIFVTQVFVNAVQIVRSRRLRAHPGPVEQPERPETEAERQTRINLQEVLGIDTTD
ncbi:putative ATP-dependent protease (CrgA) [Aspergillus candidus]|uniref:ATP-dependent protease n=1 Tax=Aspergillus candidus TaxID=41067 RepID=A0A2I2FAW5_ASPCN|nr:hypothetical protein BDW47DRAFT_34212 [Aspergillus candidus]PLB37767.1 hypothetical protein BDW47DRAFT_34212 [Aspergillus candidus]